MSHIVSIKFRVQDLDLLRRATEALGLEMVEQQTYRWFGRYMNDTPLPEGFAAEDLGRCEHAIRVPNSRRAYEVGVVPAKDGNGYELLADFWRGGFGLQEKVGPNCRDLVQRYAALATCDTLGDEWFVEEQRVGEELHLTLSRGC